jgi:hypothetical protein
MRSLGFLSPPASSRFSRTRILAITLSLLHHIHYSSLLFSNPFAMAQRKTQSASSSTSHPIILSSSPAGRAHSNAPEPPPKRTTTTTASWASDSTAPLNSAPLQVYLRSGEPVDRLVKAQLVNPHHNQQFGTQGQPRQEVGRDDGTEALDRWMEAVTAHPERAMWYRDLDRVSESTTQLYESLPSTVGGAGYNDRLHRVASQESMQPVLFCYCCPPYPTEPRSSPTARRENTTAFVSQRHHTRARGSGF